MYTIFTDAAADLPLEWYDRYEIRGVPMEYLLSDQVNTILPGEAGKETICDCLYEALAQRGNGLCDASGPFHQRHPTPRKGMKKKIV